MWQLDHKEGWVPKNWYFWPVVLEKTLEGPLDWKEVKPVNPKENISWMFIGRTDAEAETPILWPPHVKNQFTGKDPDAGKDWRQEEKGTIEDKMVGWHHRLNGCEFEQTEGDSGRQGSLVCCSSQGRKELDTTYWQNNNKANSQVLETESNSVFGNFSLATRSPVRQRNKSLLNEGQKVISLCP